VAVHVYALNCGWPRSSRAICGDAETRGERTKCVDSRLSSALVTLGWCAAEDGNVQAADEAIGVAA